MKKHYLLLFSFITIYSAVYAQIPNGNFESWTTIPNDWHLTHFRYSDEEKPNVTQYQPAHSGNYAVKLETTSDDGPGIILGTWVNNPIEGVGGFPYTQKPTKLRVWAKYDMQPDDSASIFVYFKKNGAIISETTPAGLPLNIFTIGGNFTSGYTQLEFDINGLDETPDTIVYGIFGCSIYDLVNDINNTVAGSYIIVDDLSFDTSDPVPYGGFEEWGIPVEMPDNWNFWGSYEVTLDCGITNPLQKTTDSHGGQYALKAFTYINQYYDGNQVAGDIVFGDYINNQEEKFPCTIQNGKYSGWYKYIPANENDHANVSIDFYKDGVQLDYGMDITLDAQENYTKFERTFNLSQVPDHASFHITTSIEKIPENVGSTLYIDDLSIGLLTSVETNILNEPSMYPNPTSGIVEVSLNASFDSNYSVSIYNAIGQLMQTATRNGADGNFQLNLASYPLGVYVVQFSSENQQVKQKLIKR